jgi:hypothetical protein
MAAIGGTVAGTTTNDSAASYAAKAAEVADKLKQGGYESVKALALISIAKSLVSITASLAKTPQD